MSEKCDCATSRMFPHRKEKCALKKSKESAKAAGEVIAPGIRVRNETEHAILFVLSQLTPLHWARIESNETHHISCGRVFFTVSTEFYKPETEPTPEGVAARLVIITGATVMGGALIGIGLVGGASALTSYRPCKIDGVLADGKTVVVKGRTTEEGVYELYIDGVEFA